MNLPIIASLSHHVRGLETLTHFVTSSFCVCLGCHRVKPTIAPVSLLDGGEVDPDGDSAAYLCEGCSIRLPQLSDFIRSEWPALTALEVERVWALIRREQSREADAQAARERSVATSLEDVQRALAAVQQSRSHQGVDRVGKVA